VIFFYRINDKGVLELLWQRRSSTVDRFPGDYDISAGGHINLGESMQEGAVRECLEEIGAEISKEDLKFVTMRPFNKNRFAWVFVVDWTGKEENFKFHFEWLKECKRVLKQNGTLWVSGTYHSIYQCGYALQLLDYHILNDIAWLKPNASPNLSCRFFTASHETLIWARKDKKSKHTFNYEAIKNWKDNYKKEIKCTHCGKIDRYEILHETGNQMRSVWAINTPKKEEKIFGKHPTQKSLDLLKRIIIASTNENDLILDPFAGSCTTGVACRMYNRNFVGIDVEKEYLEVGKRRINNIKEVNNA
jgi:site-specific DNA-methyltransferase (adenine-specific)